MCRIYFCIKDFMGILNTIFIAKSKTLPKYKKAADGFTF